MSPPCTSPRHFRICSTEVSATSDPHCWQTRCWLEHAVIGLNLCPFASAVHRHERLWFSLTRATNEQTLLTALDEELSYLLETDPQTVESILLIHPLALTEFEPFNDFLATADQLIATKGHIGEVQIASFHPHYQFAGEPKNDVSNNTNRSPLPMLHLLRETSVSRAVDTHPDTHGISQTNQRVLTELGEAGWADLRRQWDRL